MTVTAAMLFKAICFVESGNDPKAHNEAEDSRGIAQIRAIMVDDVNRIIDLKHPLVLHFDHDDAWDVRKSYRMWTIYSEHYADHYDDHSLEGIARRWNGGPRGHTKKATEGYWAKVEAEL